MPALIWCMSLIGRLGITQLLLFDQHRIDIMFDSVLIWLFAKNGFNRKCANVNMRRVKWCRKSESEVNYRTFDLFPFYWALGPPIYNWRAFRVRATLANCSSIDDIWLIWYWLETKLAEFSSMLFRCEWCVRISRLVLLFEKDNFLFRLWKDFRRCFSNFSQFFFVFLILFLVDIETMRFAGQTGKYFYRRFIRI